MGAAGMHRNQASRASLSVSVLRWFDVESNSPCGQERHRNDCAALHFRKVVACWRRRSPAAMTPAVWTRECGAFIKRYDQIDLAIRVQMIAATETAFGVVLGVVRAIHQHGCDAEEESFCAGQSE